MPEITQFSSKRLFIIARRKAYLEHTSSSKGLRGLRQHTLIGPVSGVQWSSRRSFHMSVKHTDPIRPPFLHFSPFTPFPLSLPSQPLAITILSLQGLYPAHLGGDCGIWLSASGLVLLTQCPSVQFIFVQMTGFHFYLRSNKTLHAYIIHFLCPFICWWATRPIPYLSYCEQCCGNHGRAGISLVCWFHRLCVYTRCE